MLQRAILIKRPKAVIVKNYAKMDYNRDREHITSKIDKVIVRGME